MIQSLLNCVLFIEHLKLGQMQTMTWGHSLPQKRAASFGDMGDLQVTTEHLKRIHP